MWGLCGVFFWGGACCGMERVAEKPVPEVVGDKTVMTSAERR